MPGLAAKPVIDIDIVIPDYASLPQAITALASLGYTHHGDQGIPGREVFKRVESPRTNHLYVCPQDSIPLRNHLVLRDYLRSNTEARDTYAHLKFDLAQKHSNDMHSYIRGKTDFILAILGHQGFDSNSLDSIRRSQ